MAGSFLADLHIHSHFSVATSKNLDPEHLDHWARLKGLTVIGTGDFTHPGWLDELGKKLEPAEQGLFKLKDQFQIQDGLPDGAQDRKVRFILSAEISTIYKRKDKTSKVHHLILAPDFQTARTIQHRLARIGNIQSDGRPILGLDPRDLLEITLQASQQVVFIPAHIWTPWFSALGDKGGFDSIEDCYGDLATEIHAIETGLSSDPAMNWRCSRLDRYTIVSNSDAHSPENLGREANIFTCQLSYPAIREAIITGAGLEGTVEFFPQEGKYHYDGHRRCNICWHPEQTIRNRGICPACGRPVTIGVMHRVVQLADRPEGIRPPKRPTYLSVIPLKEILSQILQTGVSSRKVDQTYRWLIQAFGSEFDLLLYRDIDSIEAVAGPAIAKAIDNMRQGRVKIQEGFDGQYGVIHVFDDLQMMEFSRQGLLFSDLVRPSHQKTRSADLAYQPPKDPAMSVCEPPPRDQACWLDEDQAQAAQHLSGPAIVIAGPGTGKTRVLTYRIANLIDRHGIEPSRILAITFTRKAAEQMSKRLEDLLPVHTAAKVLVCTFHQFGLILLQEQRPGPYLIIDQHDKQQILHQIGCDEGDLEAVCEGIALAKQQLLDPSEVQQVPLARYYKLYQQTLSRYNLLDLEDLLFWPARLLQDPTIAQSYRTRFQWVLVDEYQDVNHAQYVILKGLCPPPDANIFAIGDPNQAIYGFRGADVRFIKQFADDYPSARIYTLSTSYRCTDTIVSASNQVISQAGQADPSRSLRGIPSDLRIQLVQQPTDKAEAEFVARTIERMVGGVRFFSIDSQISDGNADRATQDLAEFAILCRTSAQMPTIEKALLDHSIPYQRVGQQTFLDSPSIRPVLDRLRLSIWPDHPLLIERLMKHPALLELSGIGPEGSSYKAIRRCVDLLFGDGNVPQQANDLLEWARQRNLSVEAFVRHVQLVGPSDLYDQRAQRVALMTLHASKGLEFACVFIVGCEDGLIPHKLLHNDVDIEEERRLLYVGMTRAKQWLYLTWAQTRSLYGKAANLPRSPFLDLIEDRLLEQRKAELPRERYCRYRQMSLFE